MVTPDTPGNEDDVIDLTSVASVDDELIVRVAALAEEVRGLRTALENRAVIEQAKGIVMATTGCDADAAFEVLRTQSQHTNRKLRDVAAELVGLQALRRP